MENKRPREQEGSTHAKPLRAYQVYSPNFHCHKGTCFPVHSNPEASTAIRVAKAPRPSRRSVRQQKKSRVIPIGSNGFARSFLTIHSMCPVKFHVGPCGQSHQRSPASMRNMRWGFSMAEERRSVQFVTAAVATVRF